MKLVVENILDNKWMLAVHVLQECKKAKFGDRFEYEDAGIVIECI